jgi:hypothetical protein
MTRKVLTAAIAGMLLVHGALKSVAQFKEGFNDVTMRVVAKTDTAVIPAVIWLPNNYSPAKKYALVIYAGSHAASDSTGSVLLSEGLPAILKGGFQPPFDCIVICPLGDSMPPRPDWLSGIITDAVRQFPIDTGRIYLSGIGEGGSFCFGSQLDLSPDISRKVAAICVILGNTDSVKWKNLDSWAKNKTPIWLIVGQSDGRLLRDNISIANALNRQIPGLARISIPPVVNTGTMLDVFDGTFHDKGPTLWNWFHQYTKVPPPVHPPPARSRRRTSPPAVRPPNTAKTTPKQAPPQERKTRIVIEVRDNQVYCTEVAKQYDPRPGDTLVIPTGIASALLRDFSGSPGKPIIILPADSGWIGGYSSYAMVVTNAKYFRLTGFHLDGRNKSDICLAIGQQTSDYELSGCVIRNSVSMGLVAKQDPDPSSPLGSYPGFSIRNVSIHDITVRNTGTEGFYIGYTFDKTSPLASPLVNVDIHDIDIDSTGWDGLQLSNCQQVSLHHVAIRNFGLKDQSSQRSGLLLGAMVTIRDSVYKISISNGSGVGLLVFGRGLMRFNNILLRHTGLTPGEHAIYVNDYKDLGYGLPPLQLQMRNIRIDGSAGSALTVRNDNGTMVPGHIEKLSYQHTKSGIRDDIDEIIK